MIMIMIVVIMITVLLLLLLQPKIGALKTQSKILPAIRNTAVCNTLGGSAKLAAAPAFFCLNHRSWQAEDRVMIFVMYNNKMV